MNPIEQLHKIQTTIEEALNKAERGEARYVDVDEMVADYRESIEAIASELADAVEAFNAATFEAMNDNSERFTCDEAEAVAAFYRVTRSQLDADEFLAAHAESDRKGDLHYGSDQ